METIKPDYNNLLSYFPFDDTRAIQRQALCEIKEALLDNKIKFIILDGPTGSGKSGIGVCTARAAKSAYTLTATKNLQHQYTRDFDDLAEMRGRDNYRCEYTKDYTKSFFEVSCKAQRKCSDMREGTPFCNKFHTVYSQAATASNTLLNFHAALVYLNTEFRGCIPFAKRNLLLLDEAHNIIDAITEYNTFEVRKQWFDINFSEFGPFPVYDTIGQYLDTLQKLLRFVEKIKEAGTYRNFKDDKRDFVEQSTLSIFKVLKDPSNYIVSKDQRSEQFHIAFRPLEIKDYAHQDLFRHADKTMLMSATFLDPKTFCEVLNIPQRQTKIIRMPCTFPVENRPFILGAAVGYLNRHNLTTMLPSIVERIDEILDRYPDSKGIIHSVTYQIGNYIEANLKRNKDRLLYARNARSQSEMLRQHTESKEPTILLSPSMDEGVDLKGHLSTLQILVKTPWAYLGDPLIIERKNRYENYYEMLTALKILQCYGRSIRSDTDKADTYCIDAGTHHFIYNNQTLFPPWFLKAVTTELPR